MKPSWSDLLQDDINDDAHDDVVVVPLKTPTPTPTTTNSFATMLKGAKNQLADSKDTKESSSSSFQPGWLYMKKNPWGPGNLFQPGPPSDRFCVPKKRNRYENETKRNQALYTYRIALEQYHMDSLNECLGDLSPYWDSPPAHEKYEAYEDFVASTSRPKRKIKNITKG